MYVCVCVCVCVCGYAMCIYVSFSPLSCLLPLALLLIERSNNRQSFSRFSLALSHPRAIDFVLFFSITIELS